MIAVKIDQLLLSNVGFVVLLKGEEDERTVPIFIGPPEAQAIAIAVNHLPIPRPLTHDLMKNILDFLECRLKRVDIHDLKEGTFFANLVLEHDGAEMTIDARPSDGIALALRSSAPIFVSENVMDQAGQMLPDSARGADQRGDAQNRDNKPNTTPTELLKRALQKAIETENFEEAARIRDELKRLDHPSKGN